MATITNKIEVFEKIIYEKHIQTVEKELDELKKKYVIETENQKESLTNEISVDVTQYKRKALEKSRKIILQAKIEAQREMLQAKSGIIDRFKRYIEKEMESFVKTEKYKTYFAKKFQEALESIGKQEMRIIVRKEDIDLTNSSSRVDIDNSIIGGFIIIVDEKIKYDYTINTTLEENSEYFGQLIQNLIEEKEGENHEYQ
ncbi:MAG: Uncharacterized protein XD91_0894 [Clostridiales bacterium 38_11]|nr:MAG: Uncharacterized protein XD91_0894 [Clostridiales bacterium 38_11]HBH13489.1 hypothetical protein [Clostridiales bacterium]